MYRDHEDTDDSSSECSCSFDAPFVDQHDVVIEKTVYLKRHRPSHFRPYSTVSSLRPQSEEPEEDSYYDLLCSIRPNTRRISIRSGGLLSSYNHNTSCSVEARRNPSVDGEMDELSDYFTHYVSVQSKMSALAESMYV